MSIVAIRGAITVDRNNKDEILKNTKKLILEMEKANNIQREKVISIIFTATKDLNADYPAKAARLLGYIHTGLMCFNEMDVVNSLERCIRIMILYDGEFCQGEVKHVYLKDAKILRPDLIL